MGACSSAAKIGGWALTRATGRLPSAITHSQTNTSWVRLLAFICTCICSYNSVRANPTTRVARSRSLRFRSCRYVAWSLTEASHGVSSIKRGGSTTCLVTGRRRQSPLEQGGLEVPCELAFSGTEQLTKNVRVHVRTITLGGRLPRCQHVLQGRKGRGGRLHGYPPQIARNAKNGGGHLREHGRLPGRIRHTCTSWSDTLSALANYFSLLTTTCTLWFRSAVSSVHPK